MLIYKNSVNVKTDLDVDDVEWSRMSLAVDDGSNSTSVTTSGDHAKIARFELDEVHNLVGVDVQAKGIVNLNFWPVGWCSLTLDIHQYSKYRDLKKIALARKMAFVSIKVRYFNEQHLNLFC